VRLRGFYEREGRLSPLELSHLVARNRYEQAIRLKMRAKAVEMGLNPDETYPEDLELLAEDSKNELIAWQDYRLTKNILIEQESSNG